jgi:hypothetical protein
VLRAALMEVAKFLLAGEAQFAASRTIVRRQPPRSSSGESARRSTRSSPPPSDWADPSFPSNDRQAPARLAAAREG